ncbi:MAG: TAT leader-containing periplasmic protein [Shewanella sp.]|nr:TAT leader-containing periplasmic protein [Shewanella sp.]MCF1437797.1 TAT leader-containing periplasmic protein [Shewanella sp.]MCF1459218.1 TAT leader-containing periplasmic protein [Shewanella sp.]
MKRRTFLTGAFAVTTALAVGMVICEPELDSAAPGNGHRELFAVVIPVLLDGALPSMPVPREAAINRTLDAIEQTLSVLPADQQQQLELLLLALESRLGTLVLTGSITPLLMRSTDQLAAMLDGWRDAFLQLQQQAYYGLRELVMVSFYACPEHWPLLHYAKPAI